MSMGTSDDELERTLEKALDIAESDRVKYHLREAMQLRISGKKLDREQTTEPPNY